MGVEEKLAVERLLEEIRHYHLTKAQHRVIEDVERPRTAWSLISSAPLRTPRPRRSAGQAEVIDVLVRNIDPEGLRSTLSSFVAKFLDTFIKATRELAPGLPRDVVGPSEITNSLTARVSSLEARVARLERQPHTAESVLEGQAQAVSQRQLRDVPTKEFVDALAEHFSRHPEVKAVYYQNYLDETQVLVVLETPRWDESLMDRLLEDEYEVRVRAKDHILNFFYPSVTAVPLSDVIHRSARAAYIRD